MAGQKVTSGLFAKYGAKLATAVQKHTEDETDYGFQRIPAGITNGVAQLSDCYFDQYKSGENKDHYYFRAVGVVVNPESIVVNGDDMIVRGMQTSLMIPCCDTKTQAGKVTTQEENIAKVLNEMRKLAGDDFTKGAKGTDLEGLAETLKTAAPFFKFSTSVRLGMKKPDGSSNPDGVWENWYGSKGLEDFQAPEMQVQDDTTGSATNQAAQQVGNTQPTSSVEYTDGGDLDSLVERANNDDMDARKTLTDMAVKAGHKLEDVENAASWEDVKLLASSSPTQEATTEAPTDEWIPAVGDHYNYTPMVKGPGGKVSPAKAPVLIEVTSVDSTKKTLAYKVVSNPKSVGKDIPWDKMEAAPQ